MTYNKTDPLAAAARERRKAEAIARKERERIAAIHRLAPKEKK